MDHSDEMESTCSIDTTSSDKDPVSEFMDKHLDDVLDMYYHFQDCFRYCPEFLGKLKSINLTDFILMHLHNIACTVSRTHTHKYQNFVDEYQRELNISYSCVNGFTWKWYGKQIPQDTFYKFCHEYSYV